jgi:hypothetical protein
MLCRALHDHQGNDLPCTSPAQGTVYLEAGRQTPSPLAGDSIVPHEFRSTTMKVISSN